MTPAATGRTPRGALLVIGFEFCERFGFYTMLALLALFLTGNRAGGGLGWSDPDALGLVGIFTGLMYGLPMLGGVAADRLIGHRRAVALGGSAMAPGYALLAVAAGAVVTGPARPSGSAPTIFWAALTLLVAGNALMKSTLVVLLGNCFPPEEGGRREAAYANYYAAINLGGLLAGFASGSIAAAAGWAPAFACACAAMTAALACYLVAAPRHLPAERDRGSPAVRPAGAGGSGRVRVALLSGFAALLLLYHVGSFQLWGTMSLFLEHDVDRRLAGFTIPTQWFTSVNAFALIVAAPAFGRLWRRLGTGDGGPGMARRYAIALALGASGLLLFAYAARPLGPGIRPVWVGPAAAIAIQAVGEVAAWTSTYGLVYRLAPAGAAAATMGLFYAGTLGLGGFLAGRVGSFATASGDFRFFAALALATGAAALAAMLLDRPVSRLASRAGVRVDP